VRDLLERGRSDLKGEFFQMEDCRLSPRPSMAVDIICAGQSDVGLDFSARYADYNFCFGKGVNTPTAFAPVAHKLSEAAARLRRDVESYVLFMVIADETDEAAMSKWERYKAGADSEALKWLTNQGAADTRSGADTNVRQMANPTSAVNINMGTLVGSYATIARLMDEVATVPGTAGALLTFDDFIEGVENFGTRIQPLMKSRSHVAATSEEVV
jgi:pyrimidine oxygenase